MQRYRRQSGASATQAARARARRSRQDRTLNASGRSPVVKSKTLMATGGKGEILGMDRRQALITLAIGVGAYLLVKHI